MFWRGLVQLLIFYAAMLLAVLSGLALSLAFAPSYYTAPIVFFLGVCVGIGIARLGTKFAQWVDSWWTKQ